LDDARILGFLREPFTSVLKSLGKPMIDAKGLKHAANSNFEVSFNPGSIKTTSRRTSPIPTMITQSQTEPDNNIPAATPVATNNNNFPHVIPSHGTVEMMTYRRYLLKDIKKSLVPMSS
jgi:hypothetical protein